MFNQVAIIGVGLIGGSLGGVLKEKKMAERVVGCGRTKENLKIAVKRGLIDEYTTSPESAAQGSDIVVLATPVTYYTDVVKRISAHLKPQAILTDVGSVKKKVIEELLPLLPEGVRFVPAHPVAGTEKSGAQYAFTTLFQGRKCVITPCSRSDDDSLKLVSLMWEKAGMTVEVMDPDSHDEIMAYISHLPHMVAYALVDAIGGKEKEGKTFLRFSAGGFRDFTRVASSPEEMWRDICLWNPDYILDAMRYFEEHFRKLREYISDGDGEALEEFFRSARRIREKVLKENGGI